MECTATSSYDTQQDWQTFRAGVRCGSFYDKDDIYLTGEATVIVRVNNSMTCEIRQHNNDISIHQGKYIDLKEQPERANELPEAKEWPELGAFVAAINKCNEFRTCGCTASGITEGGYEAPFVDIAFQDTRVQNSPNAIQNLSQRLCALNGMSVAGDYVLELCDCSATLPDGTTVKSLRLWLLGSRSEAPEVFRVVLDTLHNWHGVEEYVPIAEEERTRIKRERSRGWWSLTLLITAAYGVLSACVGGGTMLGYILFGWIGAIAGSIVGVTCCVALIAFIVYIRMILIPKVVGGRKE